MVFIVFWLIIIILQGQGIIRKSYVEEWEGAGCIKTLIGGFTLQNEEVEDWPFGFRRPRGTRNAISFLTIVLPY